MKLRFFAIIIIILAIQTKTIFAQLSYPIIQDVGLDSTINWLKQNLSQDTTIGFLDATNQAMDLAKNSNDNEAIGQLYSVIASWKDFFGAYHKDTVLKNSELSVQYLEKSDNSALLGTAYRTLSIDYLNANRINEANKILFKAIDLYQSIDDPLGEANINRTLSLISSISEDYKRSIEYGNMAIPVFQEYEDHYKHAVTLMNLIEPYRKFGDLDQSQKVAEECIQIVDEHVPEEIYLLARAYAFKGETSFEQNKLDQSQDESQKAFDIVSNALGEDRAASYLTGVADVNMAKGNLLKARDQYLFILKNEDNEGMTITPLYDKLQECYTKLGDFQESAKYQGLSFSNQRKMLEDKIKNLEEESLIKYESGKKDQAIAAQQTELSQRRRIQTLSYVAGGLLALLLLGVTYNYRRTKRISQQLKIKNDENELLLKEIHHRVKNNLEIVSGLLELQSAQIDDQDIKKAMRASQNRVQAMGILHQKLYQGTNLGSIEMKDYFINLSEGVLDSFDADQQIKIELAMENLELDIDTAVPIGLIVNELLTNALKYAFNNNEKGLIQIELLENNHQLYLSVKDNEMELPPDFKSEETQSLGYRLIHAFSNKLNAVLDIKSNASGTQVALKIPQLKKAS